MEATACLRGANARPIRTRVVNVQTYVDAVLEDTDPAERTRFEQHSQALALIGLEPATDYTDNLQAYIGQVGAFYDSETDSVTVLERGESGDSVADVLSLVHEFSHALQHRVRQASDDNLRSTLNQRLARGAMREGDVTLTTDRAATLLFGGDPEVPNWSRVYRKWTSTEHADYQNEPLRVSLADRYFLYAFGTAFLEPVYRASGQAGIDDWVRTPPLTAKAVLAGPERARAEDRRARDTYDPALWQMDETTATADAGLADADASDKPLAASDAASGPVDAASADAAVNVDGGAAALDEHALEPFSEGIPLLLPALQGMQLLTLDSLGTFVFEAFANDFSSRLALDPSTRARLQSSNRALLADHLSLWRDPKMGTLAAVYRLRFADSHTLSAWQTALDAGSPGEGRLRSEVVDGDLVLVASNDVAWLESMDVATLVWTAVNSAKVPSQLLASPRSALAEGIAAGVLEK